MFRHGWEGILNVPWQSTAAKLCASPQAIWGLARATPGAVRNYLGTFRAETPQDDLEFLPASLELVKSPPSPIGRGIIWTIALFFAMGILWACLGKVDVVAVAPGKIVLKGQVKTIQPLERGVVKRILVSNGESVEKGQLLLEMDTTMSGADSQRYTAELQTAKLELARLHALLLWEPESDLSPTFNPPDDADPEKVALVRDHLVEEADALQAAIKGLASEVDRSIAQAEAAEHRMRMYQSTLPIIAKRANAFKGLYEQGVCSEHEWLNMEQQRLETLEKLGTEEKLLAEAQAALMAAQEKQAETISSYKSELLRKKTETESQIQSLQQELVKAEQRVTLQHIVAPVAGKVQQLSVHTEGGVATEAQPLLVIVPDEATLEVEARVQNKDIGFVHEGQAVEIKLEAFPYTEYGIITGKVLHVSGDAVSSEDGHRLEYVALCSLDRTFMSAGDKEILLSPGMQASVEIKIKKRRLIQFFLSPLLKYANESMKER